MKNNKIQIDELNSSISNYAKWISIIGVIGALLLMGSSMGLDDPSVVHYGKMKSIQMVLEYIPLWIANLLYFIPYLLFFVFLNKGIKEYGKPSSGLMVSYIVIVAVVCLLNVIESDDISVLVLLFGMAGLVLESIIAINLISNFDGRLKTIAIIMMIEVVVSMFWLLDIDDTWFVYTVAVIEFLLDYYLFSQFAKLFAGEETVL